MKKLAILVVAGALALGACGKKKDTSTPATGDMGNPTGDTTGGDAYGADAYGTPAPEGGEGNPCGGAANPCG
jgi:hypothetical protein